MAEPALDLSADPAAQFKSIIERIERLEEEKAGIAGDIKVLRKIVAMRKRDHSELQEKDAIVELYMQTLGMQ